MHLCLFVHVYAWPPPTSALFIHQISFQCFPIKQIKRSNRKYRAMFYYLLSPANCEFDGFMTSDSIESKGKKDLKQNNYIFILEFNCHENGRMFSLSPLVIPSLIWRVSNGNFIAIICKYLVSIGKMYVGIEMTSNIFYCKISPLSWSHHVDWMNAIMFNVNAVRR